MALYKRDLWMMAERRQWDRRHGIGDPGKRDQVPEHLFTDNDPATTIKGCGFKNKEIALRTIELATQPGCTYKSYWTVRAMRERAAHHPHQTNGMRQALSIFDEWLEKRKQCNVRLELETKQQFQKERQQRVLLVKSFANKHARRYCSSLAEFHTLAKRDKQDATKQLKDAAHKVQRSNHSTTFALKGTSFVSIFGMPGIHGYGYHSCMQAKARQLQRYRCVCSYRGIHEVQVVNNAQESLALGKRFPFTRFTLIYDGSKESGRLVVSGLSKKKQTTLATFFSAATREKKRKRIIGTQEAPEEQKLKALKRPA